MPGDSRAPEGVVELTHDPVATSAAAEYGSVRRVFWRDVGSRGTPWAWGEKVPGVSVFRDLLQCSVKICTGS